MYCRSNLIDYLVREAKSGEFDVVYIYSEKQNKYTADAFLGHINQQMLGVRRSLFGNVLDEYQSHANGTTQLALEGQIRLMHMLSKDFKTIVVVDALDELTEDDLCRKTIVEELCGLRTFASASILLMSRPLPDLENLLAKSLKIEVSRNSK